jgi:hypothetical protein
MNPSWYIPRRTALRSLGVSLALPFLEAMVKPGARAAAGGRRRFIAVWGFPCGVVGKKDAVQKCRVAPWTPDGAGSILGLAPDRYLKPFFDANLQSKITIVTGLSDRQAVSHNCGAFLGSNLPGADGPMVGKHGSADHVIASELKRQAPDLRHLVLSAVPPNSGGPTGTFRNYVSFTPTQALPLERDPRAAFEALFGGATVAATPEARAEAMRRQAYDLSILDAVRRDARGLTGRLGSADRQKLEHYLTGVRELEERTKRAGTPAAGCVGGGAPAPAGPDVLKDNAQLDRRVGLMLDIIVKAIECDRARVASFMFACAYGLVPDIPHLGLAGAFHGVSHYLSDAPKIVGSTEAGIEFMNKWTVWVLERYAYLMKELDRRTEPDGTTLLDSSILYISGEHCDSHFHSNGSMPVILGGRGGRDASGAFVVKSGRHVRYPPLEGGKDTMPRGVAPGAERSVRDLLWAIIDLFGPKLSAFGEAGRPLDLGWADAVAS